MPRFKHGHGKRISRTPTYKCWMAMCCRCHNPHSKNYSYYGAKGITVCYRWSKYQNFLADMGEKPEGMTIDRIDSAGNYDPTNCRWATRAEQSKNRSNVILVMHKGRQVCLKELSSEIGVPYQTLVHRYHRAAVLES